MEQDAPQATTDQPTTVAARERDPWRFPRWIASIGILLVGLGIFLGGVGQLAHGHHDGDKRGGPPFHHGDRGDRGDRDRGPWGR